MRSETPSFDDMTTSGLLILRSAVGVTILSMAAHHVITWSWFNDLLHHRFDPVFAVFLGESGGRAFVSFFCVFQTVIEFAISIPLLLGIRIPVAAFAASLLFIMNTLGLFLEEIINPGDQHVQRLQVILWNHLQFLMAIAILVINTWPYANSSPPPSPESTQSETGSGFKGIRLGIADGPALALLCMRSYVSIQLLIPILWITWVYLFIHVRALVIQSELMMPSLLPVFPVLVVSIGAAAVCIAVGLKTRLASAIAAIVLLFSSCQFLMRKESQSGFSLYFQYIHAWNVVFLVFAELAMIATFWSFDRYSVDGWLRRRS